MRRPATIRLALMGGGAVLVLGGGAFLLARPSAECREARLAGLETAEALCRSGSGSGSGSSYHSSLFGPSSGRSSSGSSLGGSSRGGSSSVSTGGFGGSAHAAGS